MQAMTAITVQICPVGRIYGVTARGDMSHIVTNYGGHSPAVSPVTLICPDCDEIDGAMCPLSRWHAGTGRGAAPHLAGEAATKERGETWLRECESGHHAVNTRGGSRGNTTEGDKVNISLNYEPE